MSRQVGSVLGVSLRVALMGSPVGDAWMGSDFTNDDLVRGSSLVDDFDCQVTGTAKHDGRDVWRVVLNPKPKAVVVWGKIEMLVERASCVPLHQRFYDEDGKVARTMTFGDVRSIGWRRFPARMSITPADSVSRSMSDRRPWRAGPESPGRGIDV